MRAALVLALTLTAAACSRSEPAAEAPPPPPPPPPKPAALQALFPAGPVAVPAPFHGLQPSMRWAAATAKVRSLGRDRALVDPDWPGLRFIVDRGGDRISRLSVELPTGARAPLTKAWGAPTPGQDPLGRPIDRWWAPKAGLRATLTPEFARRRNLVFEAYQPAEQALARVKGRFGLEAQIALLGADAASIAAAFGAGWTGPDGPLQLAPTEHGAGPTHVQLRWAGGRVTGFTVTVDHDQDPGAKAALFAALAEGRGAPTLVAGVPTWTTGGRHVAARHDPATRSLKIQVRPLADATAARSTKGP